LSLFNELKRRKVFRVAIGYVIAAWLVVQVADLVADNFLLSWAFDLTADGIKRTENGEIEGSLTVSNKSILALVGGFGLIVAVVVISVRAVIRRTLETVSQMNCASSCNGWTVSVLPVERPRSRPHKKTARRLVRS